jgi:hypothetical protein
MTMTDHLFLEIAGILGWCKSFIFVVAISAILIL